MSDAAHPKAPQIRSLNAVRGLAAMLVVSGVKMIGS